MTRCTREIEDNIFILLWFYIFMDMVKTSKMEKQNFINCG